MKNIVGIGFEIPSNEDDYIKIDENASLSDHDIAIFSPNLEYTHYYYDRNDYEGKPLYDKSSSARIIEHTKHWRKEINAFLESGKTVVISLKSKREFYIYSGEKSFSGTGKNRQTTFHVHPHSNYSYIPFESKVHNAKGKIITVANSLFTIFYSDFKDYINYEAYIETKEATPLFTTRNKDRVLGCYKKVNNGYIIFIPYLDFTVNSLIEQNEETGEKGWNKKAFQLGKRFVKSIADIDKALRKDVEKTPKPVWADKKEYALKEAEGTKKEISKNDSKIRELEKKNRNLKEKLIEQESLKDLLFETGKPLELAVIKALKVLGYQAENYDDGELELDQVIISPENIRFIGECEGKDNKDIDIGKFRQLQDSLSEDFERDEIEEKAFGLLFGNPKRMIEPAQRGQGFTTKCLSGAKRETIGLIRTPDLFDICKKIIDTPNEDYKANYRKAIYDQLGSIIEFPEYE